MRSIFRSLLFVFVVSVALFFAGGFLLDYVFGYSSFFVFRIDALKDCPYWFFSLLLFLAWNGFWMIRFSTIEGRGTYGSGSVSANIPIQSGKLFGLNLLAIVGLLILFIIISDSSF
jgi:hypothetical protein